MKKKNIESLIHLLEEHHDWIISKQILTYLNISPRTLRNYIQYINTQYNHLFMIESSNAGYRLKKIENKENRQTENKPFENRMYFILQRIVLAEVGVDIFELSDDLFVSVPTIEKDLIECRKFIKNYDLNIERSKDLLFLNGKEIDKRKIMRMIYTKEYNTTFYNITDLEKIFGYELHDFKEKLLQIIQSHDYDINEYTLGNIIYHIVVSIERMQDNQYVHYHVYPFKEKFIAIEIVHEIQSLIESYFHVQMDENELYYLQALVSSKTTINTEEKGNYKQSYYIHLINRIIEKVNESYLISLDDEEFKTKFALHVQNMVIRASNNFSFKNPLTQSIKSTSPLIYDLSVYIANLLTEELNIYLPEDEITYIALHVGSCLELKQKNDASVNVILVCPAYNNLHLLIKEKLEYYFANQLVITKVVTRIGKEISVLQGDLIISTVDIPFHLDIKQVNINTFMDDEDILKVQTLVNKIKHEKKQQQIKQNLISLFDKRLFIISDEAFKDEFEVIDLITSKMTSLQLVQQHFAQDVIKREKLSSTAFNNIVAVPHSINMDALQTTIAVLITKKPIPWGDATNIKIVSLIAMNYKERNLYRDIYDEYIKILSDPENVNKLAHSKTYEEFINQIIQFIDKQND
ncbi:BglG family transcription antiterminator [Oceanobacillus oncorhynchi]|uniref:BglG family transcription antiterminator n=1 Tax=Oceanobacillus oncorhynchi TaxID=545501 RepID=UPI001865F37D|nr:PTS sugar transporter subunit IIA [Oceanobacillus oncorhynchi]